MGEEHKIQNEIRLLLPQMGVTCWRANVGGSWTADQVIDLPNGDKLLRGNVRRFNTGLPRGFPDLFGMTPVEVAGQTLAVFTAIEVKGPHGRISKDQQNFVEFVISHGGIAGVARSDQDAQRIILKGIGV